MAPTASCHDTYALQGLPCALSDPTIRMDRLVAALDHALLVVAGGLVVGVDDGVGGHTVGVVGLGPGVDGVDVGVGVEEKGEHFCSAHRSRMPSARDLKGVPPAHRISVTV